MNSIIDQFVVDSPHHYKRDNVFPPSSLNFIITFIILFVLQTGIFYLILRESSALGIDANEKPIFIYPENIHEAFIIESIVASSLILLYSSGFLLLYQASKHVYNKKIAIWYLTIAIILISISFVLLTQMLKVKIPKPINSN
ncbi:MAG: hypothetical protein ACFFDF_04255 [Candidatus Odinarchaeota archaeon]